jgi:hypothetical protein
MTGLTDQLAFEAMTAEALSFGEADEPAERGEVFTRRWIVELILDLVGYTADRDLANLVAVEPACGHGAFLVPMVERLLRSCSKHGHSISDAEPAIRAFDLLGANAETARQSVVATLQAAGVTAARAHVLASAWVRKGDFLLYQHEVAADFVVGNPPYIRLENLPPQRNAVYRDSFATMRGRSDIFVGFIECGLRQLRAGGVLGFIVADRWMRNQYGAGLRSLVRDSYSVDAVVQLHDVDAFEDRVAAYPAITVISKRPQARAVVADTTKDFGKDATKAFVQWVKTGKSVRFRRAGLDAARTTQWFDAPASWPSGNAEQLAVLADIEARFPAIESPVTGTRVGIGVASGADSVYLADAGDFVESDRLLPLVMSRDIADGSVQWSGTHLVNPWREGRLVDLHEYPLLAEYLRAHGGRVRNRHVAKRNPDAWYRTIDRVEPGLLERPKLLLPDMKSSIHPVLEEGRYYPHHNLYFITSDVWDLEVLGGLLLSEISNLLVGAYCVKMRGGCFRFQAQYLRRIRVPDPNAIRKSDKRSLASAFRARDTRMATEIATRLYGLETLPRTLKC